MSVTRRGKIVIASATAMLVSGGALAYYAVFPDNAPAFVRDTLSTVGLAEEEPSPPPTCPLTGVSAAGGKVPHRAALAVKVENHPDARPQAGLNEADIVVEEPVEGGYTRFIAVFQCGGSDRVGPVRSGRTTDPDYLRQLGPAVFAYAGAVPMIERAVPEAGLTDVNYDIAVGAYTRDDLREAPHNVYTTTAALWKAGRSKVGAPAPVFTYADAYDGRSKRVAGVHLSYSWVSDVYWRWSRRENVWLRSHGDVPHAVEGGEQVSATNVVVQVVQVTASGIRDVAGNASPDVRLTGSGKAYVLRDGRLIVGRWERPSVDDVTRFIAKDGTEIALAPGRTWVELLPSTVEVERLDG
jgi:hypothetical protein